jgi:carbohydrate-selective porin OprB
VLIGLSAPPIVRVAKDGLGTAASLSKDGKSVAATKGSKQIVGKPSKQGLGWFGRIAFEPQNRNFVGFYFETGLVYAGLIPTRDEDELGIGFAYAQLTRGKFSQREVSRDGRPLSKPLPSSILTGLPSSASM